MLYVEIQKRILSEVPQLLNILALISKNFTRQLQGVKDTVFVKTPLHRTKIYAFAEIFILLPQWCHETSRYTA